MNKQLGGDVGQVELLAGVAVRAFYAQGIPTRQIAKTMGFSWTTARNFAYAEIYSERNLKALQPSLIDPDVEYLTSHWDEGCHNASQLWLEMVERGYIGARIQVARWARKGRKSESAAASIIEEPKGETYSGEAKEVEWQAVEPTPKTSLANLPGSRELDWLLIRA